MRKGTIPKHCKVQGLNGFSGLRDSGRIKRVFGLPGFRVKGLISKAGCGFQVDADQLLEDRNNTRNTKPSVVFRDTPNMAPMYS